MGNLTKAQRILMDLELYLQRYISNIEQVSDEIKQANLQITEAATLRSESVHTKNHDRDVRFDTLDKLTNSVKALIQRMSVFKASLEDQKNEKQVPKAEALSASKPKELDSQTVTTEVQTQDSPSLTIEIQNTKTPDLQALAFEAQKTNTTDGPVLASETQHTKTRDTQIVAQEVPKTKPALPIGLEVGRARVTEAKVVTEATDVQKAPKLDAETIAVTRSPPVYVHEPAIKVGTSNSNESTYTTALNQLEDLFLQEHPKALDPTLKQLLDRIKKLKAEKKEKEEVLIDVLSNTYLRLTGQVAPKKYEELAYKVQGKPSTGLKILGGFMLSLSIAIAALGAMFIPFAVLGSVFIPVLGTATTFGIGAGLVGGTVATLGASIGFFAKGCQSGLSKEISVLNKDLERNQFIFSSL